MRILLLSYHIYPNATAEGLCVAKAARTLADRGHSVEIVTSTANDLSGTRLVLSDGLLAGIPLHRVAPQPERVPLVARAWHGFTHAGQQRSRRSRRLWDALEATTHIALGCAPAEYAWAQAAAAHSLHLLDHSAVPFDLLYSRLNHFLSHYAALAVARARLTLPWCAHFSDPWPGSLYPPGYQHRPTRSGVMEWRQALILDTILRRADSLTFPGDRLLRFLLKGRRAVYRAKAYAVPHLGNFWQAVPAYHKGDTLRIVFTGYLLTQRNPAALFAALVRLRTQIPAVADQVRVEFVGRNSVIVDAMRAQYDLGPLVSAAPPTDFATAAALNSTADVLLMVESTMTEGVFMPSKLADYLSARRPILALSPPVGTVADYLSVGGGLRVDPADPDAILAALLDLYRRWQAGTLDALVPPPDLVARVSPACVGPGYEAAFAAAVAGREGHRS